MKKQQIVDMSQIERISADVKYGLSQEQVSLRKSQGLTNKVERVVGKTYTAIFLGNIFTFFNMLGLSIMVLMFILGSFSNLFFSVVILANTFIGIIQEIKAKKSIEDDLHSRGIPEVEYFFEHFIPSFELTLDELEGL